MAQDILNLTVRSPVLTAVRDFFFFFVVKHKLVYSVCILISSNIISSSIMGYNDSCILPI